MDRYILRRMADHPKAKPNARPDQTPPRRTDRTSALVAGGMLLLTAIGVGTIFSDSIAGALASASPAPTSSAPAAAAAPAPSGRAADGGSS
jgi:hypothetical protein